MRHKLDRCQAGNSAAWKSLSSPDYVVGIYQFHKRITLFSLGTGNKAESPRSRSIHQCPGKGMGQRLNKREGRMRSFSSCVGYAKKAGGGCLSPGCDRGAKVLPPG